MRLRGNLFFKIFAAFWLVTVFILASWMLSSQYFESQPVLELSEPPRPPPPGERPDGPRDRLPPRGEHAPHRMVLALIYDLQTAQTDELPGIIERAREKHTVDVYLLDRAGNDLLDRDVPEQAQAVADELRGRRRRAQLRTPQADLVAHAIYREEEGRVRAVLVFDRTFRPLLALLGSNPVLRLVLALLVSGLVCYALSRLLTSRIKDLQLATRKLAQGDLEARIDVPDKGGDETAELARDFNSMAGQLQERVQAQKRLLSDVSHELRSPLARLRIALALAQERDGGNRPQLARIEQEAERLEQLIGQLLASQPRELALDTHIDLVALLRQLCEDANFEGRPRGKSARLSSALDELVVASHGDLLHKTFDNILRNALAHTADNTEVDVSLDASSGQCRVRICDRGPGVPDSELERIFDAFYRVDTARSRDTGGHGLGLSIAHRAIAQHRGNISARNTGQGLEILVTLPVQSS